MINQIKIWNCIGKKAQRDYLPSFAAHAALFIIMSIFPMVMFLIALVQQLPIEVSTITEYAKECLPDTVLPLILQIIDEVHRANAVGIKAITLITTLICASKGFYAIRQGLNAIYGINELRNIVLRYIIAISYVVAFTIMVILTLGIVVLGGDIFKLIMHFVPGLLKFKSLIRVGRIVIIMIILTVFFLTMYIVIPNRKTKLKYEIKGALFTAVGWTIFSVAFSYYKDNIAHYTVIYGSLATMVIFMLWFYASMYIFFLGAECNVFRRLYIENDKDMQKTISMLDDLL